MKLITRNTDYAIRAMAHFAKNRDKRYSVSDLVVELKIPRPFLRKILQVLNKKDILKSYKGQDGGFALAVSPTKIFLLDLIEVFQGPFKLNECFFKKNICPRTKNCLLKKRLDKIEKYVIRELESVSIAHLLK